MRLLLASALWTCCALAVSAHPSTFVLLHAERMASFPQFSGPQVSGASPIRPIAPSAYRDFMKREAEAMGLPLQIAEAVAQIESGYDPTVVGSVGEIGLMQVRPSTAAMMGFRGTVAELANPEINIRYGVRYLAQAWRLSDGNLCRALMKYRAGHGSETMSPLSVTYCTRAQAVLNNPQAPGRMVVASPKLKPGVSSVASATAMPKGLKRGSPEFHKAFWAAHEARIAKLRAQTHAVWRGRGWKPT